MMGTLKKRFFLLTLAVALLLTFSGCEALKAKEDANIRRQVDTVLNALLANDPDAAYAAFYSGIDRGQFDTAFPQMRDALQGVQSYTLTPIQYNYSNNNGVVTVRQGYLMTANEKRFVVDASVTDGYDGLLSFHITPEEQTTLHYTGTLGNMDGAGVMQWIILILGILTWVFVIWMAVDCCRRQIHRKPLWLVLIILGSVLFFLSISESSVTSRFNFGLHLSLSSLIRYGDGSMQLNLLIPAGAIVYGFLRKRLPPPPAKEASEPVPEAEETN